MTLLNLRKKITFLIFLLIASFSSKIWSNSDFCTFQKSVFKNGNSLFSRGQYLLSSTQYLMLFKSRCQKLDIKARYNYSLAMLELGEENEFLEQFRSLNNSKSAMRNGLKEALDFHSNNLQNPKVKFWNNLDKSSLLTKNYLNDSDFMNSYNEYQKTKNIKSPLMAGVMSAFIPGLGQAYNGSYQSAAVAFIINALFLGSTIQLADKGLDITAVASGAVFSITYLGNIVNAVRGSHKINEVSSAKSKKEIKGFLFPVLEMKF